MQTKPLRTVWCDHLEPIFNLLRKKNITYISYSDKMLLIRPLVVSLVLITNTWLLSPVRSDALRRYKRAMARRADRELSSLAGEPCTVSAVLRSRRQSRSVSMLQHRPQVAPERTHRSRRGSYSLESTAAVCAGGCRFETGGTHQVWLEKRSGDGTESVSVGAGGQYEKQRDRLSASEEKELHFGTGAARPGLSSFSAPTVQSAVPSSGGSRSRFSRNLHSTFPYVQESNSSLQREVSTVSPTDPRSLQTFHTPQLEKDGDQKKPTRILEGRSDEDSSGEVEEVDSPVSQPGGSPSPWRPMPRVPSSWMTALYFGGRQEQLKLTPAAGLELPRGKFSLELWVKAEGGQSNPAVVAGESTMKPGDYK